MVAKKHDVSEYITASQSATLLTGKFGRRVRRETISRISSRCGIATHVTLGNYRLYLKSAIESLSEKDVFPGRIKRKHVTS